MAQVAPYFPFWWEQFWASCRLRGMRPDEIGGYLAALSVQWSKREGFDEANPVEMRFLTGWDIRTCKTLIKKLVANECLERSDDGIISNQRMTREIEKFCIKQRAARQREDKRRLARVEAEISPDFSPEVRADLGGDLGGDVHGDLFQKLNDINGHAATEASTNTPVRAREYSESQSKKEKIYAHSAAPNGASVPSISRAKPRPRPTAEQWEAFWKAYPRRRGKDKAKERFMQLSPDDADKAIVGAVAYAAECAAEGTPPNYRKWAQGWLGERRWNDYGDRQAEDPADTVDGKAWGWWRGMEGQMRGVGVDGWRKALDAARPNGTWPWWKLGPPPGHEECLVPAELVEHHGWASKYAGRVTAHAE